MSEPVAFRRLLPEEGTVTAAEAVRGVAPPPDFSGERPYVIVNMVSTADGRATLEGRAGAIGNRADRELFHQLRTRTDAVMAGAGTVRVEHYRRLVRDPQLRAQRERDGLRPDPLAIVVSGRLDLPLDDVPLLGDPDSQVAIVTRSAGEIAGAAAELHYVRSPGDALDLGAALGELRSRLGVRSILCEGGPTLNGALLAEGLVDELFLSLSPKLTAGPAPLTIVAGEALPDPVEMELLWLLESEGHLFLRYALRR
jgi:riboflavin-specific deaminase-like protein